jgi:two-component system, sensor histidine kinase and response regulator
VLERFMVDLSLVTLRTLFSGTRILIVDDDHLCLDVLNAYLMDAGLLADYAHNGEEAISLAKHTRYPLVIIDIHMPVLGGFDALTLFRSLPGYEHTPIYAFTTDYDGLTGQKIKSAEFSGVFPKPVLPEALYKELLKSLVNRKKT